MKITLPAALLTGASVVALAGCNRPGNQNQISPVGDNGQEGHGHTTKVIESQKTPNVDMVQYRTEMFKTMEKGILITLCRRAYTNAFILDALSKNDSYEMKDEARKLLAEYDIEHRKFYGSERSQIRTLGTDCARFGEEVVNRNANKQDKKDALSRMIDVSQRMDKLITKSSTINIHHRPCEPNFCLDDGIDQASKMFLDELEHNSFLKSDQRVVNYQYSWINGGDKTIRDLYNYYSEGKGKRDPGFIRTTQQVAAEAGGGGQ